MPAAQQLNTLHTDRTWPIGLELQCLQQLFGMDNSE